MRFIFYLGISLFFFTMGLIISAYASPLKYKYKDRVSISKPNIKQYYTEQGKNIYKVHLDYCADFELRLNVKVSEERLTLLGKK